MFKIKQYFDLVRKTNNAKRNFEKARQEIVALHSVFENKQNTWPYHACINMYQVPIMWKIHFVPGDPEEYTEHCEDFRECGCSNQECPIWKQNAQFIKLRDAYNAAIQEKAEFVRKNFRLKNK